MATKKQEEVGSLSFSVIDASSPSSAGGSGVESLSKPEARRSDSDVVVPGAASAVKNSVKKPVSSRKKVPFEKGFSQVDWLRCTQTHPDLAGT